MRSDLSAPVQRTFIFKRLGGQLTIIVILANNQLLQLAVLAHLAPHVLVESIKVVLQLAAVHPVLGIEGGILVHVGHQDGLRVGWLDMFPRAPVTVSAGADFVVKGAIDLVLLGTENGCEVVGHVAGFERWRELDKTSDVWNAKRMQQ